MTVGALDGYTTSTHLWTYYLLGGNKQQLAVYNGREVTDPNVCSDTGHRVHFYPTEYLTYGNGASALITTRPDSTHEYKIVDHLGSTRVVLNDTGGVISQYDYEPFGKVFAQTGLGSRKSYIDKEKDEESGTSNFGVRQMADWNFTSIDPMWENYRAYSPYNYCGNNPVKLSDPDGKAWPLVVYALVEAVVVAAAATVALYQAKQTLDRMQGFPSTNPYSMSLNLPLSQPAPNTMNNSTGSTGAAKPEEKPKHGSGESTTSNTDHEAFGKAKDANGVPRSQQPDKQYMTPDKTTGKPLRTYDFTSSTGEKVTIRKDNPVKYKDGGSQGKHHNAGKTGQKLNQHHDIK
ncbi:MAG: hypothetical protein HYZ54_12405 [Ignavibacteriae bacterium]|nr:hypothetical protein [Ignavibacteriota bacterium]